MMQYETMPERSIHYNVTKPLAKNVGENNGQSKLSTFQVRAIRLTFGLSQEQLAIKFGVKRATIQSILNNKTWRHLL
jgi:DNA-binding XRE family transcriptional regulator